MSSIDAQEIIKKLKKGQRVRIRKDIRLTIERHNIDSGGNMRKMADGETIHKIRNIGRNRVYIGEYMWAPEDIMHDDEPPGSLQKTNILFDPKEII